MSEVLRERELAEAALAYIKAHPKEWDQGFYFCGTTACFAGHVLVQAGVVHAGNGKYIADPSVFEYNEARNLLGWNDAEANYVFYSSVNNYEELERRVSKVLAGDIRDLNENDVLNEVLDS